MDDWVLTLPKDVREALRLPEAEQKTRLGQELAMRLYDKGLLPLGKARDLAGLSTWDSLARLARWTLDVGPEWGCAVHPT